MKNKILLFLVMFTAIALLPSCEDEVNLETNVVKSPYNLSIYGTKFALLSGVIWQSNDNVVIPQVEYIWEDSYIDNDGVPKKDKVVGFFRSEDQIRTGNFMIALYGDGLAYSPSILATKGKGAAICLHLASSDMKQLKPGKYTFNTDKSANTFLGYFSTRYDMSGNAGRSSTLTSGEVNLEKLANGKFKLSFHGKNAADAELSCNYEGHLYECVVPQLKMIFMKNINLPGLHPRMETRTWYEPNYHGSDKPDTFTHGIDTVSKAFIPIEEGVNVGSKTTFKAKAEIALVYNEAAKTLEFRSPIKMRALLDHLSTYNFSCHTIFMRAPTSFTDADFDNLEETGVTTKIVDQVVTFSTENFQPGYVFFEAGSGAKGAIKVKSLTDGYVLETDRSNGQGYTIEFNQISPQLVCDIKSPTNFGNPKLR